MFEFDRCLVCVETACRREEEAKGTVYFFRLGHHIYFTGFLGKRNGGSQFFGLQLPLLFSCWLSP